jgi:hypothetical protein
VRGLNLRLQIHFLLQRDQVRVTDGCDINHLARKHLGVFLFQLRDEPSFANLAVLPLAQELVHVHVIVLDMPHVLLLLRSSVTAAHCVGAFLFLLKRFLFPRLNHRVLWQVLRLLLHLIIHNI